MDDIQSLKKQSAPSSEDVSTTSLLNSIDARLTKLESSSEKGLFGKIQSKASFFALMIGILLSILSLSDTLWTKPREERLKSLDDFNKAVNAVASLRQNLVQVQFQNNPQLLVATNSMVLPQILANIQYATALLPKIEDMVGTPQLIVLISEAINIYDWKSAEFLVERALSVKNSPPAIQSEAHRFKARVMFSTGKVQEGRKAFEDSLRAIRNEPGFGINGARAYIVADWVISEYALGDCNVGNERIREFKDYILQPQIMMQARAGLISTLKTQLDQIQAVNKRCVIPAELAALG